MRRLVLILLSTLALTQAASAWGPEAHKLFCREAVSQVWGEKALSCLDDDVSYCQEVGRVLGDSVRQQCLDAYAAGVEVDPSTAPSDLFNDVENHYNYEDCPLKWVRDSQEWICSGVGKPAGAEANMWFDVARNSTDMCQQVRAFCTGSFYYTSSFFPLLRVSYLQGCLSGPFDVLVDGKLVSGEDGWVVKEQCTFSYMKQMAGVSRRTTQHVTFILSEGDFNSVLANLTEQGLYVRNPGLMAPTTTSTSTTHTTVTSTSVTVTSTTVKATSTTSTTVPTTSTTIASQTTQPTTTISAPPSTQPTTTIAPPSTIAPTTTQAKPATTTSTATTLPSLNPELNESMVEIDSLLDDMMTSMNKSTVREPKRQSNLMMLGVLAFILVASLVLLVHVYSMIRRPSVHYSRDVVLPPSARRKMRKAA